MPCHISLWKQQSSALYYKGRTPPKKKCTWPTLFLVPPWCGISLNQAMHLSVIFILKCNLVWRERRAFLLWPKMADVEGLVSSEKKSSTKRKVNAWCSAANCSISDSWNPDISFFRFPSNPERYVLFRHICDDSKTIAQGERITLRWANNCLKMVNL